MILYEAHTSNDLDVCDSIAGEAQRKEINELLDRESWPEDPFGTYSYIAYGARQSPAVGAALKPAPTGDNYNPPTLQRANYLQF